MVTVSPPDAVTPLTQHQEPISALFDNSVQSPVQVQQYVVPTNIANHIVVPNQYTQMQPASTDVVLNPNEPFVTPYLTETLIKSSIENQYPGFEQSVNPNLQVI